MIRIGIVGCGRILNAHLQGFQQIQTKGEDYFRITALVARKKEDALMFHTRGQGPPPRQSVLPLESGDPLAAPHTYLSDFQSDTEVDVFTDYRQMIDAGIVDAVLDTTPVFLHHQFGMAALDAGLHLLTQKPLAITVKIAQQMVDVAKQKQVVLGVFENARYRPLVRAARWAFASGLLGEPQLALMGSFGGLWSPARIVAETPWRHDKLRAGGGGAIDIGVHQMDVMRYVMGEIALVQALAQTIERKRFGKIHSDSAPEVITANVDDTYLASIRFVNDGIGQLLWSWAGHGEALEIPGAPAFFGSRGCIQKEQLILDDEPPCLLLDRFENEINESEQERLFPMDLRDPFAVLQWQWLQDIENGSHLLETDGDEGLRDLAAAYAILESSQHGRAVSLEEVLNGSASEYQREIDDHYLNRD